MDIKILKVQLYRDNPGTVNAEVTWTDGATGNFRAHFDVTDQVRRLDLEAHLHEYGDTVPMRDL